MPEEFDFKGKKYLRRCNGDKGLEFEIRDGYLYDAHTSNKRYIIEGDKFKEYGTHHVEYHIKHDDKVYHYPSGVEALWHLCN